MYKSVLSKLEELNKAHPSYSFGRHISMAFAEYGDIWNVSDKEALFALEKYEAELELDSDKLATPEYLEQLYKDVEDFDNILNDDDGDI